MPFPINHNGFLKGSHLFPGGGSGGVGITVVGCNNKLLLGNQSQTEALTYILCWSPIYSTRLSQPMIELK